MISKKERRWVILFGLAAVLLTSIPYLLGYAMQGEEWVFTGFVFGVEDGHSYLAKMLSGYSGDWLFKSPYTNFPQSGLLIYLPFLLLGKLTSPPGQMEQMVAIYHLFRIFSGLMMVFASYSFISFFIKKISLRRWATALAIFGGGMGWLLILIGKSDLFGSLPLEFYSPESFGFLSLFGIPHLALARALLLWGLLWYLRTIPADSPGRLLQVDKVGIKIGGLWFLMGFFQPLTVVVGLGIITVHLLALAILAWRKSISWENFRGFVRRAVWIGIVLSPFLLYNLIIFTNDPFTQAWALQNKLPSPNITHYILAYILLLPYAIVGAKRFFSADRLRASLLIAWGLVLPFWVYAPVNIQRRFAEGIWVALIVLAFYALDTQEEVKRFYQKPTLFLIGFLSTFFIWVGGVTSVLNPTEPLFRPAAEIAFFEKIGEHVDKDSLLLASFKTSNALPAWVSARVLIGHGPESINLENIRPQVQSFYAGCSPETNQEFIQEFGINYVIWGADERLLGDWHPQEAKYLSLILEFEGYHLFEVIP